jgi:hypothetical protein
MKIYTQKSELADWIRRKLGEPLISPPLEESQLDDCIDDAVFYFGDQAGGVGNEQQYFIIDVKEDRNVYDNGSLVSLEEGNCDPFDVSTASGSGAYKIYCSEYQLPRNVVGIMQEFPGNSSSASFSSEGQILRYGAMSAGAGAVSSMGAGGGFGFNLMSGGGGGQYGTRGGSRTGSGAGLDIVSYELAMQYLSMWNQRYTVKLRAQFLEQARKVRFSPMPKSGHIMLGVWARVADQYLYEHMWVRRYALALAKEQIATNLKLYKNVALPGGTTLNVEDYQSESKEEKEKLIQELDDGRWSYPPPAFLIG